MYNRDRKKSKPSKPSKNKFFFLHLRIYNFKCLQGKISQEPNIFFSFTNLQFQMPARKNITRAKHFFLHLRIYNFKCLQGKISQEPNIFFCIYESTISNACKEKYHKSQTFFFNESTISNAPHKKFQKKKNTKESFSSVFGYSPRL